MATMPARTVFLRAFQAAITAANPTSGDVISDAALAFVQPTSSISGFPTVFPIEMAPQAPLILPAGDFWMSVTFESFSGNWFWTHSSVNNGVDFFDNGFGTFNYSTTPGYVPASQAIDIIGYQ